MPHSCRSNGLSGGWNPRRFVALNAAFLMRLIVAVCLTALASPPAAALDQISMQLKWRHQFQFAGYYAALDQGFYRNAGFDVTTREGGPAARRELQQQHFRTSVTTAATNFGFWHLGRFADEYRSISGESPSSTLARRRAR
jgi:hypothetical protein